ncbi:MAG TPA: ABC transporter permease [Solirubrobacteraceae bacterium]|nr:ABC transporter permease [Solirubrobacteraceae bacterium]
MSYLWHQISSAVTLIVHGDPYLMGLLSVTARLAAVSTIAALIIGLPIGAALGLGRFRGRRALQLLANASLALPPVVVGVVLLVFILPRGPLGSLRIEFTLTAMYVAQTILALPYLVALTAAAIQGLPPGVVDQARALGAGRIQLAVLALREARIGVLAAIIAAVASTISEVGAVIIVGGNVQGQTESLASALLAEFTFTPNDPRETATALILLVLVLVLVGTLTVVQQRTGQLRLRFREG